MNWKWHEVAISPLHIFIYHKRTGMKWCSQQFWCIYLKVSDLTSSNLVVGFGWIWLQRFCWKFLPLLTSGQHQSRQKNRSKAFANSNWDLQRRSLSVMSQDRPWLPAGGGCCCCCCCCCCRRCGGGGGCGGCGGGCGGCGGCGGGLKQNWKHQDFFVLNHSSRIGNMLSRSPLGVGIVQQIPAHVL